MTLILLLLLTAQEPVAPVPDVASWVTAAVNPTLAAIEAARSPRPRCEFLRLGLKELSVNGSVFTLKHFIRSPRPCLGCPADGFPSGHSANSIIGWTDSPVSWEFSFSIGLGTGGLRQSAHRHTTPQVIAGLLLGGLTDYGLSRLIPCE